jgi:hypothetical protein
MKNAYKILVRELEGNAKLDDLHAERKLFLKII